MEKKVIECRTCEGTGQAEVRCKKCAGQPPQVAYECRRCGGAGWQSVSCPDCRGEGD